MSGPSNTTMRLNAMYLPIVAVDVGMREDSNMEQGMPVSATAVCGY